MNEQWKPIATAPKDRRVLLYIRLYGCSIGDWDDDRYAKNPRPFWRADVDAWMRRLWMRANQPTHWMELPGKP
jgi:hypothetical protein